MLEIIDINFLRVFGVYGYELPTLMALGWDVVSNFLTKKYSVTIIFIGSECT